MTEKPASPKRTRKSVTKSVSTKKKPVAQLATHFGGWILFLVALMSLGVGVYALVDRMKTATAAHFRIEGSRSEAEFKRYRQQLAPVIQGNYFNTDLTKIRDRLMAFSWVDRVMIERSWPNSILIDVSARNPIARWSKNRLLSDNGIVYSDPEAKKIAHLPLLQGPISQAEKMMISYESVNQMFQGLDISLTELYLTDRMTWFMEFDNGLRVIVDQDQTMRKVQRLSKVMQNELKAVSSKIALVDLRYRNGMAVQWKDNQKPAINAVINKETPVTPLQNTP